MSVQNFIATIWSARLNENLRKALVYGNIVNTDYEGEIVGKGSTVKINSIGSINIGDYDKNTGIGDPQELDSYQTTLVIDQAKYFNFKVDDVDKAQMNVNLVDAAMQEAAYALADAMDQYIASLYTEVAPGNTIGSDESPIVPTKDNAYDYLVDLLVKLDEANVPKNGRFVVVPSWFAGLLKKDPRFTSKTDVLITGEIGMVDGATIYESNNVPNVGGQKYKIMAGYRGAIAFVRAINSIEAYRPEKSFADAVKGLALYGAKVIKPNAIAVMTCNRA
ncbi:phage capsid protein [Thermosediminibacter oceani]|uniref:P22 coat protein-protein 5 domain protein n=1 Tax=Thermosediminibacter oceani (strain ATCC BAA-1034 / DSM 16646 / JW/IW-1228P) TaxID=555079 RepID=D9S3Q9_THEOJ|nr:phage capsid protein [Thermosediminibacter oceani]ADL08036.1 conserved hypothetical protein [Thermosediminibacter oceani DSM 16646]